MSGSSGPVCGPAGLAGAARGIPGQVTELSGALFVIGVSLAATIAARLARLDTDGARRNAWAGLCAERARRRQWHDAEVA